MQTGYLLLNRNAPFSLDLLQYLYPDNYTIDGSTFHVFLLTIQSHTKYCIQADNVEKNICKNIKKGEKY